MSPNFQFIQHQRRPLKAFGRNNTRRRDHHQLDSLHHVGSQAGASGDNIYGEETIRNQSRVNVRDSSKNLRKLVNNLNTKPNYPTQTPALKPIGQPTDLPAGRHDPRKRPNHQSSRAKSDSNDAADNHLSQQQHKIQEDHCLENLLKICFATQYEDVAITTADGTSSSYGNTSETALDLCDGDDSHTEEEVDAPILSTRKLSPVSSRSFDSKAQTTHTTTTTTTTTPRSCRVSIDPIRTDQAVMASLSSDSTNHSVSSVILSSNYIIPKKSQAVKTVPTSVQAPAAAAAAKKTTTRFDCKRYDCNGDDDSNDSYTEVERPKRTNNGPGKKHKLSQLSFSTPKDNGKRFKETVQTTLSNHITTNPSEVTRAQYPASSSTLTTSSSFAFPQIKLSKKNNNSDTKTRQSHTPGKPIVIGGSLHQKKRIAPSKKCKNSDPRYNSLDLYSNCKTRSQKCKKKPEMIELLDGDDDDDDDDDDSYNDIKANVSRRRTYSSFDHNLPTWDVDMEVATIAIGRCVYSSLCRFAVKKNRYELLFANNTASSSLRITRSSKRGSVTDAPVTLERVAFQGIDVVEVKSYQPVEVVSVDNEDESVDDNQSIIFLVFQVRYNHGDDLEKYKRDYDPDAKKKEHGMPYIVVEFREDAHLRYFVKNHLNNDSLLRTMLAGGKLTERTYKHYAGALLKYYKKEAELRESALHSTAKKTVFDSFLNGRDSNDLLLVYPFAEDKLFIEEAAKDLIVASGLGIPSSQDVQTDFNPTMEQPVSKHTGRAHFVTIRVCDYERLEPGEYLNDSLIDFYMQWIVRNCDKSNFHFFSSHFYTSLKNNGPSGVMNWTKNKGINVFDKRLIFIPVNQTLHWSLCVVVNPGAIVNELGQSDNEIASDKLWPGIYFFDSLKAHCKNKVASDVRKWLNWECKRMFDLGDNSLSAPLIRHLREVTDYEKRCTKYPFTPRTMNVRSPVVPYQDNGWDCGVFTCRYAYAMYRLAQTTTITYLISDGRFVTISDEFDFNMFDINLMRDEMKILCRRLSEVYISWKAKEIRKEKEEKAARESDTSDQNQDDVKKPSDNIRCEHFLPTLNVSESTSANDATNGLPKNESNFLISTESPLKSFASFFLPKSNISSPEAVKISNEQDDSLHIPFDSTTDASPNEDVNDTSSSNSFSRALQSMSSSFPPGSSFVLPSLKSSSKFAQPRHNLLYTKSPELRSKRQEQSESIVDDDLFPGANDDNEVHAIDHLERDLAHLTTQETETKNTIAMDFEPEETTAL